MNLRSLVSGSAVLFLAANASTQPGSVATITNLNTDERDTMYPGFLKLAETENASDAIRSFGFAAAVEKQHARLFGDALAQAGKIPAVDYFVCPTCGETTTGAPAPGKCPTRKHPTEKYVNIR